MEPKDFPFPGLAKTYAYGNREFSPYHSLADGKEKNSCPRVIGAKQLPSHELLLCLWAQKSYLLCHLLHTNVVKELLSPEF